MINVVLTLMSIKTTSYSAPSGQSGNPNCGYVTGLHAYTYDTDEIIPNNRKIKKDTPTTYGYNVGDPRQNEIVRIISYLTGFAFGYSSEYESFVHIFVRAIQVYRDRANPGKMLLITDKPKYISKIKNDSEASGIFLTAQSLYNQYCDCVIVEPGLYPKGGMGVGEAKKYCLLGEGLYKVNKTPNTTIKEESKKSAEKPIPKPGALKGANMAFSYKGIETFTHPRTNENYAAYHFVRTDSKSQIHKNNSGAMYEYVVTKTPIDILDKVSSYCKSNYENRFNHVSVINLDYVFTRHVIDFINESPFQFEGNELVAPFKIKTNELPVVARVLDRDFDYHIKEFGKAMRYYLWRFLTRDTPEDIEITFEEITHLFVAHDGKKMDLVKSFKGAQNNIPYTTTAVLDSAKKVKIAFGFGLHIPGHDAIKAMLKESPEHFKVYLGKKQRSYGVLNHFIVIEGKDFYAVYLNDGKDFRMVPCDDLTPKS